MKKNPPHWNKHMTNALKTIKEKVKQLPPLSLPQGSSQMVIEIDASNKAWGDILIEKHGDKEEICVKSIQKHRNQLSIKSQRNPFRQKDCKPFQALSKTCQVQC